MDFEKIGQHKQEMVTIPEIIKIMRQFGGNATTSKVKTELLSQENDIPEEFITLVKISKNGQKYKPFDYVFNFSITNLELSNFINRPKRGMVELTKKGRVVDLASLNIEDEIFAKARPKWKERSAKNKALRSVKLEPETIEEGTENSWRVLLLKALKNISSDKFEMFSRALIHKMGVEIDQNIGMTLSNDGGVDGFGYLTTDDFRTVRVAIQAKRWNEWNVDAPEIDKFRGAMDKHNAEFGVFITTSNFTRGAIKTSRQGTRVITLIDGEKLVDLVAKYELYVTKYTAYELDDFFIEDN